LLFHGLKTPLRSWLRLRCRPAIPLLIFDSLNFEFPFSFEVNIPAIKSESLFSCAEIILRQQCRERSYCMSKHLHFKRLRGAFL
jgi:hypothetical protein